jgi:outer membrane protein, multidrug efflux system
MRGLLLGVIGFAAVAGCAVGPDYRKPDVAMPKQWRESVNDLPMSAYKSHWWHSFNDPELNRLVHEAVASNLDVKQAATRIRDARAQQTVAVAAALPSVTARSNLSRRSNNLSSIGGGGGAGNLSTGGGGAFGVGGQIINIMQAGFDAQWELDIFGGIRRGIEAAEANVEAAVEDRHAVLVSLQGELARLYIQLRANQQLLAITRQDLASQQETLELTKIRNRAGLISTLDVSQQEALAADTEARLPGYQNAIHQSVHAISILLGKHPDALAPRLEREGVIPVNTAVMTDLPSELLRRRPDIRRSERQVAAANAEIGVAVAELYPKFNLASFLGIQNTRISDFTPVGKSWSAAASISMPIFNWGKLQANITSKKAQKEEYQLAYESTVLTALKEVEDALSACVQEKQRQQSIQTEVNANELSLHLSKERYRRGLTAFLDVLDSQRSLLQAKSNLIQSQAQQSQNLVALYKALGGGWEQF